MKSKLIKANLIRCLKLIYDDFKPWVLILCGLCAAILLIEKER